MKFKFILIFIALPCLSTTYYVDKNGVHGTPGNDSYSGLSWGEPWATVSKAASMLQAGDSVIIAGGVYREEVQPQNSGTPGSPIVFFTQEGAEIAGSETIDENSFSKVSGYNNVYAVPFSEFDVRGMVQLAGGDSVVLRPYFDIAQSLNEVEDTAGSFLYRNDTLYVHTTDGAKPDSAQHDLEVIKRHYGIDLREKENIIFSGFRIRSQSSQGSAGYGVYIFNCRNIKLLNDTVIGGVIRGHSYGGQNSNIDLIGCSANRVWRISTPFSYHMLPHGISAISFAATDTLLIKDCEIWWETDAGAIDGDCDSVVITDSKWWGCPNHGLKIMGEQSGSSRPSNVVLRRCIAGAECQEAVYIYYADSILIENCDFSTVRQFYLETTGHSKDIHIRNTLITEKLWIADSSVNEYHTDYNCVFEPQDPNDFIEVGTQYYTLQEWQNLSGNDMHSLNENPLVEVWGKGPGHPFSDFHLTDDSPLIDAGDPSYVPPPGGGDTIDIGVYEYQKSGTPEEGEGISSKIERINPHFLPVIEGAESVVIYDVTGRKLKKYDFPAGEDIRFWGELKKLTSGIYFFKYRGVNLKGKFIIAK